jgi:hypothetical protein
MRQIDPTPERIVANEHEPRKLLLKRVSRTRDIARMGMCKANSDLEI